VQKRVAMNPRLTLTLCIFLLLVAFGIDMATPQALVAAILLTIPVALSSLLLNRRITGGIIVSALVANVVAGYFNGVREGHHWDAIAIANRTLAGFSIVLVGWLGGIAQSRALRTGQLAAQRLQAQREQALRRSMETIRSSLNVELVARAVVREAVSALDADAARLYTIEQHVLGTTTFSWEPGGEDVEVTSSRPPAELLSLLQLSVSERRLVAVTPDDALGRFALSTLGAQRAIVVPLINDQISFGVLLLTISKPQTLAPDFEQWVWAFADQATVAAGQASLFVELANRNQELQQAIETQEHRGQVIRDLVYALSHDLRTPLAAAAMTMQQALDGTYGPLPDAYREILRRSLAANGDLRQLAETLLLVARYESGDQSTERVSVHVHALLVSVRDELEPMWRAKRLDCAVTSETQDQDPVVLGDQGELRRAVMNLLANAISWTPEGGTIRLSATDDGNRVIIRVSDSGYGVPAERRAQLFQRLATGDSARQGAGSGLGLYIVRRIAENYGGSARYEPNQPAGSIFIIELPAAPAESTQAPLPNASSASLRP
jgi:signal transduction histidine kinase